MYLLSHIKQINLTAGHQSFTSISSGAIYDSENIWITNTNQNSISKYNLSLSPITQFTSSSPLQLLSVGAYIWASDYASGYVNKINKNSGYIEASILVGEGPMGMAFDGTNIWVCNYGSSSCSVISQSSNTVIETINVGSGPTCVLFDGNNIWISSSVAGKVYISDPTSLQLVTTLNVGKNPYRMTTMNGYVYVLDISDSSIYKLNTQTILGQLTQQSFTKCEDIVNDGTYLYISSLDSNVYKLTEDNVLKTGFGSGLDSIESIQIVKDNVLVVSTLGFELYDKNGTFISSGNI